MMRRVLPILVLLATVARGEVKTGLDVLAAKGFEPLRGKKVGLVVNATARTKKGEFLPDLLLARKDVTLVTIFSPEHGLEAKKDEHVASGTYKNVPVVSLYGERKKPKLEELKGLDVLVYDIQDVGTRYYTYLATLAWSMEVAKEAGVKVLVLDRPDPAGGSVLEGPILEESLRKKFAGFSAIPTRYGLTIGEYARWVNEVEGIGCDLEIVRLEGWKRDMLFCETGLPWVNPSPNLKDPDAALLYTGLGIIEKSNLSVGRGTDEPFHVYGAPFVDGKAWCEALEKRKLGGVSFEPCEFTPSYSTQGKKLCKGVRVKVTDSHALRTVQVALHMIDTLRSISKDFHWSELGGMLGDRSVPAQLEKGTSIDELLAAFSKDREAFEKARRKVLLYP